MSLNRTPAFFRPRPGENLRVVRADVRLVETEMLFRGASSHPKIDGPTVRVPMLRGRCPTALEMIDYGPVHALS